MRNQLVVSGLTVAVALTLAFPVGRAVAIDLDAMAKKAVGTAGDAAKGKIEKDVNAKLTADARKNQCSFKTDTDELAPGCDVKLKKLTNALVEAKKHLEAGGVKSFKFEVSGHTDSSGTPALNHELSERRASTIAREMVSRGVDPKEIISVGMAADRPLVTPDDTPAKKAKNRRYEIQVKF